MSVYLAGVPGAVVERAKAILGNLEAQSVTPEERPSFVPDEEISREAQLGLFAGHADKIMEELRSVDVNSLTPVEALLKLRELQDKTGRTGANR